MPLHDIPHDERLKDTGEILIALLLQWIRVRAGHAAGSRVLIEVAVDLALVAIETILLKREWKNLDLERTPRKERRQVARQQKGVRSGNENVVLLGCMEAVDRAFKTVAHLNLIDKQEVLLAGHSMLFYIGEQGMIFEQALELVKVVIDMDDIRIGQICLHVITESLEQF